MLFRSLFDMKKDVTELKKLVHDIMSGNVPSLSTSDVYRETYSDTYPETYNVPVTVSPAPVSVTPVKEEEDSYEADYEEETMSLEDVEKEMIRKALDRNNGRRRNAAQELKISERTLYRKIKEYGLE